MTTVSELVVAIRGEGIDQTEEDLEEMQGSVEESSDALDDQAEGLAALSKKFGGAMSTIIVGLGVAVAGLLSKVPVVGELFDSLAMVIDSIALKIDSGLRPALQPVGKEFSDLATEIDESNTAAEAFLNYLETLVDSEDIIIDFVVNFAANIDLEETFSEQNLSRLAAIIIERQLNQAGYELDMETDVLAKTLRNWVSASLKEAMNTLSLSNTFAGPLIDDLKQGVIERMAEGEGPIDALKGAIQEQIMGLISDAFGWGKSLIDEFIAGIEAKDSGLITTVSGIMSDVRDYFPSSPANTGPLQDLDKTGPALVDEFAGGIQGRTSQVTSATENAVSASESDSNSRIPRARNTTTKLFIDGREAGRGTQKERFDESARRGQTF